MTEEPQEIGFWNWLCADVDGPAFVLRQRIPEVYLFRGANLIAHYGSDSRGVAVRRKRGGADSATDRLEFLDAMLATLIESSSFEQDGSKNVPVAILRRCFTANVIASRGLHDVVPGVPHSDLLSETPLRNLVDRLKQGDGEVPGVWSLQTVVRCSDGTRVVSVYHRKVNGDQGSDIFARPYHNLYCFPDDIVLPRPESVAADICYALEPERRNVVEACTLGLVLFANRCHGILLEGITFEFVFDRKGHAVLHGCWNVCRAPRHPAWSKILFKKEDHQERWVDPHAYEIYPVPLAMHRVEKTIENATSASHEAPRLLLEMWVGDAFLGEAVLPTDFSRRPREVVDALPPCLCERLSLQLSVTHDSRDDALFRRDPRKQLNISVSMQVTVIADFAHDMFDDGREGLRFGPARAEFSKPFESLKTKQLPRLQIWLRHSGDAQFVPLWASLDPSDPISSLWDENVLLPLESDRRPIELLKRSPTAPSRPSSASRRPSSARKHVTDSASNGETAPPTATERPVGRVGSSRQSLRHGQRQHVPMVTAVSSPRTHVCGAHLGAHWGMSNVDGAMRTSILAAQVAQRHCHADPLHRGKMLLQLAYQLQGFHELQLAWDRKRNSWRDDAAKNLEEQRKHEEELSRIQEETKSMICASEADVVALVKDLCGQVDEQRNDLHATTVALLQSRHRYEQQEGYTRNLRRDTQARQDCLDKTIRKYEEIVVRQGNVTEFADGLLERLTRDDELEHEYLDDLRQKHEQDLQALSKEAEFRGMQRRFQEQQQELEAEQSKLRGIREQRAQLRSRLAAEGRASAVLQNFAKRVAAAPISERRVRTGGGWRMADSTARLEALAKLRALELLSLGGR